MGEAGGLGFTAVLWPGASEIIDNPGMFSKCLRLFVTSFSECLTTQAAIHRSFGGTTRSLPSAFTIVALSRPNVLQISTS
jgi:hypothetical protein